MTTVDDLSRIAAGPGGWRDEEEQVTAVVTRVDMDLIADCLDGPPAGEQAPPMWAAASLARWPAYPDLGADGHPRSGTGYPPVPARRRLFAGARCRFDGALAIGATARRCTRVVAANAKLGRSGPQLFVTLRSDYYDGSGALVAREDQDLAYRAAASAPAVAAAVPPAPAANGSVNTDASVSTDTSVCADAAGRGLVLPVDRIRMFRFSAVTRNSHRIHYDERYATQVERLPGLLVHGPLLAMFALELPRRLAPQRRVAGFTFRLVRPVPVDSELLARVDHADGDGWAVEVAAGGAAALTGEIEFGPEG